MWSAILVSMVLMLVYLGWLLVLLPVLFVLFSPFIALGLFGFYFAFGRTNLLLQTELPAEKIQGRPSIGEILRQPILACSYPIKSRY